MAKVTSEKKYSTFVKGLITEANALTFPENASLDEDNFDLKINGSRVRRLGIDYEEDYVLTETGILAETLTGTRKSFHRWDFPGGAADVVIGVVRVHSKLWFVNLLDPSPSTALLNGGAAITIPDLANAEVETAVINNKLILVSSDLLYPTLLEYDSITQLVTSSSFPIQVRDIWGVYDALSIGERPATLTELHEYNLINQGWSDTISSSCAAGLVTTEIANRVWKELNPGWGVPVTRTAPITLPVTLSCTATTLGVYPSNADIWTLGKVGDSTSADFEKYDPDALVRNSIDNTEASKGSIIIDAFDRGGSRYIATGLPVPGDQETGRPSCVAAYAGRVWYSGISSNTLYGDSRSPNYSGYLFFSQIVTARGKLGLCFQDADPTSPNISDIIDTDGGTIQLPEVSKVYKMLSVKDSLLVFADNGIWEIYGDTGGFKATNYQTAQVSSVGITNPKAVVIAGDVVIYWAKAGIFALSPNQTTGRYTGESISLSTVQSYYNSIPAVAKDNARGFYDASENHIRWLYNDTVGYSNTTNVNHYNRQLNLDLALQAFYKYSISPLTNSSPQVSDWIVIPAHATVRVDTDVVVGADLVLAGTDGQVVVGIDQSIVREEQYSFLTFVGTAWTVSKYKNTSFMDWKTADGIGADYSSYLVTGYDTFGEIMRSKQTPYIFFYLNRTEDGFTADGSGNLIPTNPSSCNVQAQWNWANSAVGGKWGNPFQAYKYTRSYTPSGVGDTYDTGDSILVTKNKLRGSGKALSLKIYSDTGKDMQLLGWSVTINGGGTP